MSNNDLKNSKKNEVSDEKLGKVSGGNYFDPNWDRCPRCKSRNTGHDENSSCYCEYKCYDCGNNFFVQDMF